MGSVGDEILANYFSISSQSSIPDNPLARAKQGNNTFLKFDFRDDFD